MTENKIVITTSAIENFWLKVDKTSDLNGCWNWTGKLNSAGYGRVYINSKDYRTHRLSYSLVKANRENKCLKGHELTNDNIYSYKETRRGKTRQVKRCRQCYFKKTAEELLEMPDSLDMLF